MARLPESACLPATLRILPARCWQVSKRDYRARSWTAVLLWAGMLWFWPQAAPAVVLWNDPGPILARANGPGADILNGAVKRDDSAGDTLYFKFHVEPMSDKDSEPYFAGFELFEGDAERLGIGNSLEAWAYSAFFHGSASQQSNNADVYLDLRTTKPEFAGTASYQYPRQGVGATIVLKVQYVPGEDDLVTAWLNPDLGPGANEVYQPEALTTRFNANANFDEIRLRHGGGGAGWVFSDLAVATSFSDFVDVSSARMSDATTSALEGVRAVAVQSWQKEQGLPAVPVRAIAGAPDGYLWLGGDETLARFDGSRFIRFGLPEGFKFGAVRALLADGPGGLWIGSADMGLQLWRDGVLKSYTTNSGLPANNVTALARDAGGCVWVGTSRGLGAIEAGGFHPLPAAEGFSGRAITAITKDNQGTMFVGVGGLGIFQFTNNAFSPVASEGMADWFTDVRCLLADAQGRLWVGAGTDFVLCRDGERWRRYRIPQNRAGLSPGAMAAGPDGSVWVAAGASGLMQLKEGKSALLPASAGLAGHAVQTLMADAEGRVWVGTEGGLNWLKRKILFSLGQSEGLGVGAVHGLAEVSPGVVWAAKTTDGLHRWDGNTFSRLSAVDLSPHEAPISSVLVTADGFCWVASASGLRLYRDPIAVGDEARMIPGAPTNIVSLAEGRSGELWAGTRNGQVRILRENRWLDWPHFSQTNAVTALALGKDGRLWLGTDGGGLYGAAENGMTRFSTTNGLSSDVIRTLHVDSEGTLWVGTAGGLNRERDGHWIHVSTTEGLPDNEINQIAEDDFGRLWLGTGHGIACVAKSRIDEVAAGRSSALYARVLSVADGMLSEECTGGFCPAGLKTRAGFLWFSTAKGIVVVDPRALPLRVRPPQPVLEGLTVDGTEKLAIHAAAMREPVTLRVKAGKHRLEFRYGALGFDRPELTRFRYQLEGLESAWVDASTRLSAPYSYLPPGDYRFRLAASNGDGVWSETGATVILVARLPFWQTWWFLAAVALSVPGLAAVAILAMVRRRVQRRMKLLEQERTVERERRRIAQDLHDEMGAKLCRISFLSEHARRGDLPPGELHEQITSISDASREVLHSLDEIVWAVNPQNDTLEHVASYVGQYAQDYFNMTGVQCELEIPARLPSHPFSSQQRHNLFLAIHEAFTNVLKHARATQAKVSMTLQDGVFEIEIVDDGRGFDLEQARPKLESATAGDGLKNMLNRMNAIGGRCEMESAPGRGTRIRFVVFLKSLNKTIP